MAAVQETPGPSLERRDRAGDGEQGRCGESRVVAYIDQVLAGRNLGDIGLRNQREAVTLSDTLMQRLKAESRFRTKGGRARGIWGSFRPKPPR